MKMILFLMFFLVTAPLFSAGSTDSSGVNAHYEFTYGEAPEPVVAKLRLSPSQEIIDIFNDNDVDPVYLSMTDCPPIIPDAVRRDINYVISENIDDVIDKIKSELKASLVDGEIEYTYMIIGSRMFSMSLYFR